MSEDDDDELAASGHIDQNLRHVYNDLLDEAPPARFDDLLRRLKDADRAQSAGQPSRAARAPSDEERRP